MFVVLRPCGRAGRCLTVVKSRPRLFKYNRVILAATFLIV